MAKKALGDQKTYRNAGVSTLCFEGQDFEPGSEFKATLPPEQEMLLLQGGHLEIVQDQSASADRAQAAEADGEDSTTGANKRATRKTQS